MKALVLQFDREKETKNTVRFHERTVADERPVVGSLYISKEAAGVVNAVRVTIEEVSR
jgi:hypothetical protein